MPRRLRSNQFDVAILGGGPAAWSMAAAFAPTGLATLLLAPSPDGRSAKPPVWTNIYGGWVDQLDESVGELLGTKPGSVFAAQYDTVHVIGKRENTTPRSYGRFDNVALIDALMAKAKSGRFVSAGETAMTVAHNKTHSTIETLNGKTYSARIVIDATGASSRFTERPAQSTDAVARQQAFGVIARFDKPLMPENECTLMDWRGPQQSPPSFCYVLPLGDDTFLVEETVLATTSGMAKDALEKRLYARIATHGRKVVEVLGEDLVNFPMNVPLPTQPQRIVAVGAAASIVHPATGYSVAASLRLAPRLAEAIAKAFAADAPPEQVAAAGWSAVWPDDRIKARGLERYGLERVLTMGQSDVRDFFDAFFRLPVAAQASYLSGEASTGELADIMWKLFRSVPLRLQSRLASGNPLTLAKTLLG